MCFPDKTDNSVLCGFRVVPRNDKKEVNGYTFQGFGSHSNSYPYTYLTAAAAVGMDQGDVDLFIKRLDKVMAKCRKADKTPCNGENNEKVTST